MPLSENNDKSEHVTSPAENLEVEPEEPTDSFESSAAELFPEQAPEDELDLEVEYQKLRLELDEYKNLFLRKAAEFENFKKRKQAELQMFLKAAEEALILDILPVLDDFERLLTSNEADAENTRRGAQLIREKLWETLSARGLEPITALGSPFDPAIHDALMEQKEEGKPPGIVLAEHEKGYRLAGKIVRHAKVVVSS